MTTDRAARFAGRTAIITGGASGIGLEIATRLSAEGARVSLWDRDAAALDRARPVASAADTRAVDVTDEHAVAAAMAATADALGGPHILVTSAGITGPNAPVADYPVDAWRQVLEVNLTGTFLPCRAAVPYMRAAGHGRIVPIASIAGKEGNPNGGAYSASKAGVIALTKSLGKELATTPIRVNCVAPAAVRTPLFEQMTEEFIGYMLSKIPMGRFGELAEVASLVLWLASDECSFSTGATFDISGGRATY